MNARPKRPGVRQPEPDEVGLDERQAILAGRPSRASPRAVQHRRVEVDAGDPVAGLGQRDRQPTGADGELEDRAVGALGQREVEVEVARVVDEIEVVQAREGVRRRGVGAVEGRSRSMVSPPSGSGRRPGAGRRGR